MSNIDNQARFVIAGPVRKAFAAPSGKFGKLEVLVKNKNGKDCRYEVRAFDSDLIRQIADVGAGQTVKCSGTIDIEPLKNRGKAEIKIDGYSVWVSVFTLKKLEVEALPERPAGNPFNDGDDGVPF